MDLEKVQSALAEVNAENDRRQAEAEAEANKTTWDRIVDAGGAVVSTVVDWAENTASDVANAYNDLGEKRQEFLNQGAQIQQAYSPENVSAANESGDYSQQDQSVSDLQTAGNDAATATRNMVLSPIRETEREFVNAYADDENSSVQGLAQSLRQSDASLTYFMSSQEKLAKARDIEAETGISADSIINDTKAYKEALEVYDFKKKVDAAGGDINQVWNEFPELRNIADMSPQDAALALHNIESIRSTHGIIDTFTSMLDSGNRMLEYNNLQYKIMTGTADDNDRQRADDLKKQISNDKKKLPSFFDDPIAAIVGGIAQSAPEMWQSITEGVRDGAIFASGAMLAGAAAGSAAGGVGAIPGAAVGAAGGFATGMARSLLARATTRELASAALGAGFRTGMFNGMAMPEIGSRFSDYKDMKDKDGKTLLTDNQARGYAALAGYANAGIEMANFGVVTNALKGAPHASKVFGDIVEQTGARLTAREAAKDAILNRAADTFKVAASETAEEGLQSISDDLVHNRIEADTGDKANQVYSWKDIAGHAFVSMAEALPSSLGFGVMSGVGGAATGGIRVSSAMRHRAQFEAKYGENARQTMTGTVMLEQLQQAVADGEMKETAPDVQRKILKTQLAGTGYENAYIDTEMAMKKENGMDDLKAVAKAADISGEDLQTAIEEKGHIMVPVERFSQAATSPELLDSVSFSPEADSMARMKDNASSTLKEVQQRQQEAIERQQKLIDTVVDEYYPSGSVDEDIRDMVKASVFTNPSNPAQGWNAIRADRKAKLDELIGPAMARLQEGMGKGGQIMETEDENGNKKYNRFTENDEWYRNFYKAFKRAPNQQELEDMAVAMTVGDPSAPKVAGFIPTTPEEQAAMEQAKPAIAQLRADIEKLDKIKPQMKKLTGVEMELTEGLSKEGFKTYRTVMDQLQAVGGMAARAARIDAILFARHADIYADIITKKTGKKYTALDYMRERYGLDTTGKTAGDYDQEAKDNPAFTEWFGDSKVADENGNPKVIYHGTATQGIEIFDKKKAADKAGRTAGLGWGKGKFYLTEYEMAANAAASGAAYRGQGSNEQVMPVYVKIEKPITAEEYGRQYQEISGGHKISGEPYSTDYTMKDRDKFIAKLDKTVRAEGYDGIVDESSGAYAVFDSNQIKSVNNSGEFRSDNPNIYSQYAKNRVNGSIARMDNGQRIITLLETADESTFAHEMSHMFFMDLEDLAQVDDVSAKELELVNGWANWEKGAAKEYRNTPWAREFNAYERDIIDAEKHGDHDRADQLKNTWRQERFARAFELYLRDGHAPARGLKAVFRKFKSFLRTIYLAFTGDGGQASIGVRRVMDRMIATEAEIDEAAMDDRYKDVSAAGGEKLMGETDVQTYKRWQEDSIAEAKEKLMKVVMKDLTEEKEEQFRRRVGSERMRMQKQLQQEPVYLAEKAVMASGDESLALNWFDSVEAFRQALADNGPLEDVLNTYMDKYQDELDKELQESHLSDEAVREAMEGTKYHDKLEAMKATAFAKRMALMKRITTKTERAMQSVEDKLVALPEEVDLKLERRSRPVAEIMKAINKLRFSSKWTSADYRNIENMINASTKSQLQDALKEFKNNAQQSKENEKAVLDANEGKMKIYTELAKKSVLSKPIHEACDYYGHVRNAKAAAKRVQQMIRAERWDMALMAQQQQAMSSAMANESKKMQEHVDAGLQKIKKQLNAKSVHLPKEERYWHRHLAYILRMVATDARKPESGVPDLQNMFKSLTESLDLQYTPTDILDLATQGDDFKGYRSLNVGQFDDAVEALTVLYTTGRDKFKMKTIGGKDIADVVDEILEDKGDADGLRVNDNKIEDSTGGMGYNDAVGAIPLVGKAMALHGQGYIAATMKPEEIIRALGKTAHKYIYGIYEKAAEDEGTRVANEYTAMKDMLGQYTHKEKRAWKDKNIKIRTADGDEMVSKENIICMALNLGNETNIQRLTGGLGVPYSEIVPFIESHMEKKDWKLVQNIWDHLDSYWQETVAVEENLNGVALKKQKAGPFIAHTADGEEIKMSGGYYPIKYNPKKSSRAEDQDVNEAAKKTMSGAVVLGTNRGFTKARTDVDIARPLLLEFSVIPEHIQQVIHNISYRLPARDVYRLINNSRVEDYISKTIGRDYHKLLKEWATDAWNIVPENSNMAQSKMDRTIGALRRNSVMAIMGYRLWPVVENLSNIGPVMDKLGAAQGIAAVSDFYAHYKSCKTLLYKSTFMKNRINSMDRDIRQQPGLFETSARPLEIVRDHAYDMMLYSDLMLSAPLWVRAYKNAYTSKLAEVKSENEKNQQTVLDAQQKVSETKARAIDLGRNIADINRHVSVRENGTPEQIEEEKSSPFAMRPVSDLRAEVAQNEVELNDINKNSWQPEQELNKAMELDILTDDEVLAEAERRSIAEADAAIRDTFGSGETKDLSSMQRQRNELSKLFTTFYSFFNTQFNAIYANYRHARFGNDGGSKIAQWAPFVRSVMYRIVLMSLIGSALKYATGNDGGDDRDKFRKVKDPKTGKDIKEAIPWTERFFKVFAKNLLSTMSGAFVGVRDLANLAINYLFDGMTYGSKFNPISAGLRGFDELQKTITLLAEMEEKNAKIDAAEETRQQKIDAKMKKLKGKKKQEYLNKIQNNDQYRKPKKKTTYSEVLRHAANSAATFTAANTGITNTVVDAVTGTMQYINDSDDRYDPSFKNMVWSALFDKKPVDRDIPEKPPAEPKPKKKGSRKKKNN